MSRKELIAAGLTVVLLMCLVALTMAALPSTGDTILVQTIVWSAPNSDLFIPVPGVQPNGECECGGNGNCPT